LCRASIYPAGSPSTKLLEEIRDTWLLVNVVDNDYVSGRNSIAEVTQAL